MIMDDQQVNMDVQRICLQFNPVITRLAGFDYGKEIYQEQVKAQIDFSRKTIIEFPSQIIKIASSFVQGFFADIIEQIGLDQIGAQVEVDAERPIEQIGLEQMAAAEIDIDTERPIVQIGSGHIAANMDIAAKRPIEQIGIEKTGTPAVVVGAGSPKVVASILSNLT